MRRLLVFLTSSLVACAPAASDLQGLGDGGGHDDNAAASAPSLEQAAVPREEGASPSAPTAEQVAGGDGSDLVAAAPDDPVVRLVATEGPRDAGPLVGAGEAAYLSAPLQGCVHGAYFAAVSAGGTRFSLLLDQGSTTTAFASDLCADCGAATPLLVQAPPSPSASASPPSYAGDDVATRYLDDSCWRGPVFRTALTVPSDVAQSHLVADVNVVAIRQQVDFFTDEGRCGRDHVADFDGILGVGPQALVRANTTSLLVERLAAGTAKHRAVALKLCDVGGRWSLGGYDASMVAETPVFVPRNLDPAFAAYDAVTVDAIALGGRVLPIAPSKLGPMVVDSGASATRLGKTAAMALASAIVTDANYLANFSSIYLNTRTDCEPSRLGLSRNQLDAVLPPLELRLHGATGQADADGTGSADGAGAPKTATVVLRLAATRSYLLPLRRNDGVVCYSPTFVSAETDAHVPGTFLLGSSMMRQHTVVADRAGERLGFARQAACPETLAEYAN